LYNSLSEADKGAFRERAKTGRRGAAQESPKRPTKKRWHRAACAATAWTVRSPKVGTATPFRTAMTPRLADFATK